MAKLRQARSKGVKTHKRRGSYKSGGDPPKNILSNFASNIGQAEIQQGEQLSRQNPNNGFRLDTPQPPSTPPPLNNVNNFNF